LFGQVECKLCENMGFCHLPSTYKRKGYVRNLCILSFAHSFLFLWYCGLNSGLHAC
jgi:hypothetical protein